MNKGQNSLEYARYIQGLNSFDKKRRSNSFDFPDWNEVKLYGSALLSYGIGDQIEGATTLSTISTKKAIEQTTGTKLTPVEIESIQTDLSTTAHEQAKENLHDIASSFTSWIKWAIAIAIIAAIIMVLSNAKKIIS